MSSNTKIITKHWGKIDPLRIDDYIRLGGYGSLKKYVVEDWHSSQAVDEILASGLSGRGGAGFPTGEKMKQVSASRSSEKYFILNLDESEPGTYKDRAIVDNNPHLLLEGVIISSLIVGAKKAFIYINGHYQKQAEILELALSQARERNFWGRNILRTANDLEIVLFSGGGAYICGEETALINSIEGRRGEPKYRPPFPTERGLFGQPTCINNAETISNIPWIIENGGAQFKKIGASCSPGTKLFILGGAVRKQGVFEGVTGMTIREVIEDLGGGMAKGKEFWFAQIGGASGRLATENELETPLVFAGDCQIPCGSGAVLIVDKSVDVYDILMSWTTFFRRESCGKCVPCREGTFRLWEIAKRMRDGHISERDQNAISDILWTLKNTTFCPLGKFAATAFGDMIEKKILELPLKQP